jgi:glucose/arabinose dehydrogenase
VPITHPPRTAHRRGHRTRRYWLGLLVALLAVACVPPPPVDVAPQLSGLDVPWDFAFAPDNTLFFTERSRGLSVVGPNGPRRIWRPDDLLVATEAGMMSMVLSPGFPTDHRLYVCFASTILGLPDVRIARLTLDASSTTVVARTDILTGGPINPEGQLGRHSGCRLAFGPDGYLWVGTGDAAIGTAPQDPTSLGGKVLRIDGNGAAAPGNMTAPFDPRIYNYGHRNVQGLAFRANGTAFAVEHGPGCDDEVNFLRPGANYGWDPVPRTLTDPAYNESAPMTDLARFPNARAAVWSSGCPTEAFSGATFVKGKQWGKWDGGLVMAALKGSKLRMLKFSSNGQRVTAVSDALGEYGRLRTPRVGPYGALFVTTSNGSGTDQLLRIVALA